MIFVYITGIIAVFQAYREYKAINYGDFEVEEHNLTSISRQENPDLRERNNALENQNENGVLNNQRVERNYGSTENNNFNAFTGTGTKIGGE